MILLLRLNSYFKEIFQLKNSLWNQFINQYQVSKTLRFELKPCGKTEELIRKIKNEKDYDSPLAPLILEDKKRAKAYKEVKKFIDNLHREFLNFALDEGKILEEQKEKLEEEIVKFYEEYKKGKENRDGKKLIESQKKLGKILTQVLDANAQKFLDEKLKEQKAYIEDIKKKDEEETEKLKHKLADIKKEIRSLGRSNESKRELLKKKQDTLDKELKNLNKTMNEYEKCLSYEFNKTSNLYKKTEDLFLLLRIFYACNKKETKKIKKFDNFHTYFKGFNENRTNVYDIKGDGKNEYWSFLSTSIAHRLFEQNLKFHCDNIKKWEKLSETLQKEEIESKLEEKKWSWQEKLAEVEKNLNFNAEEFFRPETFIEWLSQKGIDNYNEILGGIPAEEEGKEKTQGLNEIINLTQQKSGGSRKVFPSLHEFYKQILSEGEGSFIDEIKDNNELIEEIDSFAEKENKLILEIKNGKINFFPSFDELLEECKGEKESIFLSKEKLRFFSQDLAGDWNALENWYLNGFDDKKKKKEAKRKVYTIEELEKSLKRDTDNTNFYTKHIKKTNRQKKPWLDKIDENNIFFSYFKVKMEYLIEERERFLNEYEEVAKSREQKKPIKEYLDVSQDIFRFFRNLTIREKKEFVGDNKNDEQNQLWKESVNQYTKGNNISNLYNKARNFLTKKAYSTSKLKLNFENPTLAGGWDVNKESDNNAILLLKDGQYYLAIMKKEENKLFEYASDNNKYEQKMQSLDEGIKKIKEESDKLIKLKKELEDLKLLKEGSNFYEKMNYKLVPEANKMLPKVFFAKKNIDYYNPDEKLIKNYKDGSHKKGENFNLQHCHKLIDFFKRSINKHPEWGSVFSFNFSDTNSYNDISDFYSEVNSQAYKITFSEVSQDYIDKAINEEKLYLFQIYNKDFSTHKEKRGKDNLHTLYWKALFDSKNLENVVAKLNGQAELFYRKASIKYSEEKRKKGHHYKKLKSKFDYPILKDKRYSEDKIFFHCPITLNFKESSNANISKEINGFIQDNLEKVNIIGIDRGEKNLLYFTVINQQGDILEQGTLNKIKGVDYHSKLDDKEKERAGARENWKTIENIKELKAGYLSLVVHELSKLIIKHNAIVVLEDLNMGFKRGRFKVEKQIYQKFEKALIEKLNYLVFKEDEDKKYLNFGDAGHQLKAYQLTNKFESFSKLGKQSGILFYTTAGYTSKTDPVTGYMQMLYHKYTDIKRTQEFFGKFESIAYNGEYFEFVYNLKNLKGMTGSYEDKIDENRLDKPWTICSHVARSCYDKKEKKHKLFDVNEELKKLFETEFGGLENKNYLDEIKSPSNTEKFKDSRFLAKLASHFERLLNMRVIDADNAKKQYDVRDEQGNTKRVESKEGIDEKNVIRTVYTHNDKSDFIASPVCPFYDSRKVESDSLPKDSDANGAYNVARKGIIILKRIKETDLSNSKLDFIVSKTDWQEYAQEKSLVEKQIKKYKEEI